VSLAEWAEGIEGLGSLVPKGSQVVGHSRPAVTSKHMAPGWRTLVTEYTCIPDVAHPWDPDVVRSIWRFAPEFVPMWERRVLQAQGMVGDEGIIITGRHALGRVIRNQHGWLAPLRVTMPTMPCQGLKFARPNDIAFVHEDVLEEGQSRDLPGPYLPFDGTMLRKAAELAIGFNMSDKEYRDFLQATIIDAGYEEFQRRQEAVAQDMDDRNRDFVPYARKIAERISDVQWGEYQRSVGKGEEEKKPFIVVP